MSVVWHFPACCMAKLKCIAVDGVRLWFWSDDHNPPHFHAKRAGEWELKVKFMESSTAEMFELVKGNKVPTAYTKLLEKLVTENRLSILDEWEKSVQQK